MYKLRGAITRFFEVELPNGRTVNVEPPKLKTLKHIADMDDNTTMEEQVALVARIISKNREGIKVTADDVLEWMDTDQYQEFLVAFLAWLNREHETNPN